MLKKWQAFVIIAAAVMVFILWYSLGNADTKYNPHTNRWETVSPDAQLRYNPHSNSWRYQEPGARIEFNPFQNNFQYSAPAQTTRKGKDATGVAKKGY